MPKKAKKSTTAARKKITKVSLKPIAVAIDKAKKELNAASKFADEAGKDAIKGKIGKLEELKRELPCRNLSAYPIQS
jgi:hypothetical protein